MENIEMNEIVTENIVTTDEFAEAAVAAIDECEAEISKNFKIALGVGAGLLVGFILYKKVIKPAIAKHKAKKAEQEEAAESGNVTMDELFDEEE